MISLSSKRLAMAAILVFIAAALISTSIPAWAGPLTKGYYGLPIEKKYGDTMFRARNWVEPLGYYWGVGIDVTGTGKTISAGKIKYQARAANQNHKVVKTGTWKNNTSLANGSTISTSLTFSGEEDYICGYGRVQVPSAGAVAGTVTVPASPAKKSKA